MLLVGSGPRRLVRAAGHRSRRHALLFENEGRHARRLASRPRRRRSLAPPPGPRPGHERAQRRAPSKQREAAHAQSAEQVTEQITSQSQHANPTSNASTAGHRSERETLAFSFRLQTAKGELELFDETPATCAAWCARARAPCPRTSCLCPRRARRRRAELLRDTRPPRRPVRPHNSLANDLTGGEARTGRRHMIAGATQSLSVCTPGLHRLRVLG